MSDGAGLGRAPYVLFDDARPGGAPARLYRAPVGIVAAYAVEEVFPALDRLRMAAGQGLHIAGYLTYEAGAAFVSLDTPADAGVRAATAPLLWFGLFEDYETVCDVAALLPDPAGAWVGAARPTIDRAEYDARIAQILDLIAAGDIYQANLTFPATVPVAGEPAALFARLRSAAGAGYGALIDTGTHALLSLSPELFFAAEGDRLTARPMKGTAARLSDPAADTAAANVLAADPKQRAENLMIVDLMRNDLSRVAVAGSVAVPDLFAVETYPTVHQMTSTITATSERGHDAVDVLAALFPCGSITGAPKRRAMQVIAEVEDGPRGAYCGAIGRIDPDGDAMFNVAIRTLTLPHGADEATIGLGSGIVADSDADEEWAECLAKGAFLTAAPPRFDLIETMAFDPADGIARLDRHLARLRASAERLGFAFDRHLVRNELQAATFRLRAARRIRLLLSRTGAVAVQVGPVSPTPAMLTVAVVPLPVPPGDLRLAHKTSDRGFYDAARTKAGTDEVVFARADGRLTEGSFTALFVRRDDGVFATPPLADGLLPGVLRAEMLGDGRAIEAPLTRADLVSGRIFLGNALRGLMPATLVAS